MDKDAHAPTWPGFALDTMRGADWALHYEYSLGLATGVVGIIGNSMPKIDWQPEYIIDPVASELRDVRYCVPVLYWDGKVHQECRR
jgi:hypothetical protein